MMRDEDDELDVLATGDYFDFHRDSLQWHCVALNLNERTRELEIDCPEHRKS